eukprot:tig00001085_g6947.t2
MEALRPQSFGLPVVIQAHVRLPALAHPERLAAFRVFVQSAAPDARPVPPPRIANQLRNLGAVLAACECDESVIAVCEKGKLAPLLSSVSRNLKLKTEKVCSGAVPPWILCNALVQSIRAGVKGWSYVGGHFVSGNLFGSEPTHLQVLSPAFSLSDMSLVAEARCGVFRFAPFELPAIWKHFPRGRAPFEAGEIVDFENFLQSAAESDAIDVLDVFRCLVLPGLRARGGVVVGVGKALPATQGAHELLKTETDFRIFWRDVHGLELPGDLRGYASVRFFQGNARMTYPMCCLVAFDGVQEVLSRSRTASSGIIRDFVEEIQNVKLMGQPAFDVSSSLAENGSFARRFLSDDFAPASLLQKGLGAIMTSSAKPTNSQPISVTHMELHPSCSQFPLKNRKTRKRAAVLLLVIKLPRLVIEPNLSTIYIHLPGAGSHMSQVKVVCLTRRGIPLVVSSHHPLQKYTAKTATSPPTLPKNFLLL